MEGHAIRWGRWKWVDPYKEGVYVWCLVSVMPPTMQYPHCSVLFKLGKQVIRARSVEELQALVRIPEEHLPRLMEGQVMANEQADKMERDLRRLMEIRRLPPGVGLLRDDTGEPISEEKARYITEAERILRGKVEPT